MTKSMAVILVLASLFSAAVGLRLERDMETEGVHPVMKAVKMLQDMKDELQADLDDDKEVHEMLACWCDGNGKEKEKSIDLGEARAADLESSIDEAAAKKDEVKEKRASAKEEADKNWKALNEAKAMRLKENKENHGEQTHLVEAIKACDGAIVVLSKENPELLEVRAAARHLHSARVLSLSRLGNSLTGPLKDFLSEAQGAVSFLSVPGFQSKAPESGAVFGILKQMKSDFDVDLKQAKEQETDARAEFEEMKNAKDSEISAGKELVVQLDQQFADFGEKHAAAVKDLENTKLQVETDKTFMANLKEKCSQSDGEFEKRVNLRLEEMKAVDETIEILNDDDAFATFGKTDSFLQMSSLQKQQIQRQRAAAVLVDTARLVDVPALSLIAMRVKLDNFVKVKANIEAMITQLNVQQKDEVTKKDWCNKEINANKRSTDAAYDKQSNLESKIADLTKTIESISDEVKSTTATLKEMQAQMKKASEIREADSASNRQTLTDQRMTQIVLRKAITRMKEVYAFLQSRSHSHHRKPGAAHVETSGTDTAPGNGPASFKKYEKNPAGAAILKMLDEIVVDSKKTEDETLKTEESDQAGYEMFMKESNDAITTYQKKLVDMSETKAKSKEELTRKEEDFKATLGDLEDLHVGLGDLSKSCNFVLNNFDKRQQARAAEVDALKEATAILDGMK